MALRRTAVEKANAADPSVRDPPQAPGTLDQGSPSATAAAEGRSSLDHPPRNRRTSGLLCTLKQKLRTSTAHRSRGRTKTRPLCRRSTQGAPPPRSRRRRRSGAPTGRGRVREDVIPRRRRRRRKPNPRRTSTYSTPPGRETPFPHTSEGPRAAGGGGERRPRWREYESPPFLLSQL